MATKEEIQKANEEINRILGEHISPDWNHLGKLMKVAKW